MTMSINGGVNLEEAKEHLRHMDSVMVGREAYQNPELLARWIGRYLAPIPPVRPVAVVRAMYPILSVNWRGTYLGHITRHMLGCSRASPARQLASLSEQRNARP